MKRSVAASLACGLLLMPLGPSRVIASGTTASNGGGGRGCSSGAATNYIHLDKFAPTAYYEGSSGVLWKPYYWAAEGTDGTFRITRASDDCENQASTASYAAEDGSAINGEDFTLPFGKTKTLEDPNHGSGPFYQDFSFPVHSDASAEPVIERATIKLTGYDYAFAGDPARAPFYVIDNQSAAFAFAEPSYHHSEFGPRMPVPVFRGGPVTTSQTIEFSVTGSGPNPAVEGHNFTVGPKSLTFGPGERVKVIDFSVSNNGEPDGNRTFTISLAGQTTQNETEITLVDAGGDPPISPRSRFHHPRHGWRYQRGDLRIREIHTFAFDNGGPEIEWAQFALRKKLRNGHCAWWSGSRFRGGNCRAKRWFQMKRFGNFNGKLLYIYNLRKRLVPTRGTRIKVYTGFTRVGNIAGARETRFERRRNVSSFTVVR